MIFNPTSLEGVYTILPEPIGDSRGWFARTYCKKEFAVIGHDKEWVQLNHSFTAAAGTIRGLHYQLPPYGEIKMVRCIAGKVWDVAIDLRRNSPTFLQWTSAELSAFDKKMIYIPAGFAHGFQTLTENCELIYHHSEYYQKDAEAAIRYDDPLLNIKWPVPVTEVSERDRSHQLLTESFKGI